VFWQKKDYEKHKGESYFDFRELEHVYELFNMFFEMSLNEEEEEKLFDVNRGGLMRALQFYIKMADLTDV
jgi:hypothetical protein